MIISPMIFRWILTVQVEEIELCPSQLIMKEKPEKGLRASTELEPVVYSLLSTAVICQLGYDH